MNSSVVRNEPCDSSQIQLRKQNTEGGTNLCLKQLSYSPSSEEKARDEEKKDQKHGGIPSGTKHHFSTIKVGRNQSVINNQNQGACLTSRSNSYRKKDCSSHKNEQNYIRNMLENSVLTNKDDKIEFLISEIETANIKISMLQQHMNKFVEEDPRFA
mmetsp:Transcript_42802/g.41143  ORF Transcript_42802/g.41143 Transcript_42802/m.41143 type:complete len:157 (+) Transcript_42802:388-858(+)